jgi:hypothetical protein
MPVYAYTVSVSLGSPPSVGGGFDGAADFASRSSGGGVFFAENFNYANFSAATSHATNLKYYGSSDTSTMTLNAGGTSAKYLRISYPANSGLSSYVFLYTFDNNDGVQVPFTGVAHDNFYFQIVVRGDRQWDWPYKMNDGNMASPKVCIIDKHSSSSNPGEVVLTNDHGRMVPAAYVGFTPSHGSQLIQRQINTPQGTPDYRNQPSVDDGTPASPSTMADYRNRYGPFNSDTPSIATGSIDANSSIEALGWPKEGVGMRWHRNDWDVITFHINGAGNRVKFWGSKYGEAPLLLGDTNEINFNGALDMGRGSVGYPGFQLTPFVTDNANAGGANQPTNWIDYAEIIASNNPIQHPGGFTLPGTLNALATAAAALSDGTTATFSISGLDLGVASSSVPSAATFAGRMVYDSTRKNVHFLGTSHTGGSPLAGAGCWMEYDSNAHSLTRQTYTWSAVGMMGHAYYGTTINPTDGTLYHQESTSFNVHRKLDGSSSFTTGFIADIPSDNTSMYSMGVEWFPEANSGAGGLAICDYQQWFVSNAAVTSWTTYSPAHTLPNGNNWSARVVGFVHAGEGSTHRRLSPDGSSVSRASPPISCSTNNNAGGTIVPHPNGVDLLCLERGGTSRVWRFDQATNSWGSVIGNHGFTDSLPLMCGIPLPELGTNEGVVMGWSHLGNGTGATECRIWRVPV